jgi:ATP-dependent RNA helicase HelY
MSNSRRQVVQPLFPPSAVAEQRERFVNALPFNLDPFQREAFDAIDRGKHVVVAAPTGSGKTLVGEYAIDSAFRMGNRAIYTSPIKALTNQKYKELCARFGVQNVGLLTGDNVINGDAPIVCMTTEVLRNMIYDNKPGLETVDFVILDEVHYLQNAERGPVWEEVIIHLDPAVRLVCLSATISNADEFAGWITTIRGETEVISSPRRPVPLNFQFGAVIGDEMQFEPLLTGPADTPGVAIHRRAESLDKRSTDQKDRINSAIRRSGKGQTRQPKQRHQQRSRRGSLPRAEIFDHLVAEDLSPAIWFKMSRRGCDDAAREIFNARTRSGAYVKPSQLNQINEIIARHTAGIEEELESLDVEEFVRLLRSGIGVHHAGLIPPFKETVEQCLSEGLLKVVFATETLAYGINMPVRTVVLDEMTKRTRDGSHQLLTASDFAQLTGRAGRREFDPMGGYVIVFHEDRHPVREIAELALNRTFPLASAFVPTYNIAVNLVRRYSRESAARVLNQSFAQYRSDSDVTRMETEVGALDRQIQDVRQRLGALTDFDGLMNLVTMRDSLSDQIKEFDESRDVSTASSLSPGHVIADPANPTARLIVIYETSQAGKKGMRMRGVVATGKNVEPIKLELADFTTAPIIVGRIPIPEPVSPRDARWLAKLKSEVDNHGLRPPKSLSPIATGSTETRRRFVAERNALTAAIDSHPTLTKITLHEASRLHADVARLQKLKDRQLSNLRGREDALARQFGRIQDLLASRGYLDKKEWKLTALGEVLANTYCESDLLFVESLWDRMFNGLNAPQLAAVVSAFVYESKGRDDGPIAGPVKDSKVQERILSIQRIDDDIHDAERRARVSLSRSPDDGFANVAYMWASKVPLEEILAKAPSLSGGDFVRQTKQVIDLLRQLEDLSHVQFPSLAESAREASQAMNRGIVEASSRVLTPDELSQLVSGAVDGTVERVVIAQFGADDDAPTAIEQAFRDAQARAAKSNGILPASFGKSINGPSDGLWL